LRRRTDGRLWPFFFPSLSFWFLSSQLDTRKWEKASGSGSFRVIFVCLFLFSHLGTHLFLVGDAAVERGGWFWILSSPSLVNETHMHAR
jgi:hypothetical protein